MEPHQLASILRQAGAEKVKSGGDRVTCACPLAWWTHPKGRDRTPSMVVFPRGKHGDPIYACQSCHDRGSLRDLLLFLWTRGRDTYDLVLALEADAPPPELKEEDRAGRAKALFVAHAGASAPQARAPARAREDGRPFYDYQAIAEAESVKPLGEESFAPYAGRIPKYALERGLTIETCKAFELGHDKKMKRLLFPIRDRKGRLMAISGRLYAQDCPRCGGAWVRLCGECGGSEAEHYEEEDEGSAQLCESGQVYAPQRPECSNCGAGMPPKYLHSKGFKRNLMLYGEHMKDDTDGRVYLVEGHIDMIRLWQFGYRPAVAMLGSYPGAPQIEKLIKHWQQVIVVPDGNQAGRDMAARVKAKIAKRIPVTVRHVPEGRDPGDMTPEELEKVLGKPPVVGIDNAVPMVQ